MYYRALKMIRLYHRMSQSDLADGLDLSRSFLSELEKPNGKQPSINVLEKYAEYFGIPLSSLLLFAEATDDHLASKFRLKAADKVLRMLEWLSESPSEQMEGATHGKAGPRKRVEAK